MTQCNEARLAARSFARCHLAVLSREVLEWRNSGILQQNGTMNKLVELCQPIWPLDTTQQAERIVIELALQKAAEADDK